MPTWTYRCSYDLIAKILHARRSLKLKSIPTQNSDIILNFLLVSAVQRGGGAARAALCG